MAPYYILCVNQPYIRTHFEIEFLRKEGASNVDNFIVVTTKNKEFRLFLENKAQEQGAKARTSEQISNDYVALNSQRLGFATPGIEHIINIAAASANGITLLSQAISWARKRLSDSNIREPITRRYEVEEQIIEETSFECSLFTWHSRTTRHKAERIQETHDTKK